MTLHGGDIWRVASEFGVRAMDLLDFSANINPRGLPSGAKARLARDAGDANLIGRYPDPEASALRAALSGKLDVPPESIVFGPGAEALLAPILRVVSATCALVPVPAFSEYRRVCSQHNVELIPFPLHRAECFRLPVELFCEQIKAQPCGAVFLNNPHNPSGAVLDAREVERILDTSRSAGATLLLDEAFIDYFPLASLVRRAAREPGVIILRSLTKFYGCPALRVGYAVGHPETILRIASRLPTWPITQLAIDTLSEAVTDREFDQAELLENAAERERLAEALTGLGVTVLPSATNFLLLELKAGMPPASELRSRLISRHRILIRNCDSYEGLEPGRYLRVAVRSADENLRLVRALGDEFSV